MALLLFLGAILVFGRHVLDNGFSVDDWWHSAQTQYAPGVLDYYWQVTSYRPVLVVYVPFTHLVLGENPWLHHLWSIALAVAMSVALYALLRRLRFSVRDGFAIAALVLLLPSANSAIFWATSSHIHMAIALALAGVALALRGFDARAAGRLEASRRLHACALLLYATSVLTYEIVAPVLLLAGALYLTHAPRRAALLRWAADIAVIVPCLVWIGARSPREVLPIDQMIDHAEQLADQSVTVLSRSALPFGSVGRETVVLGLLALIASSVAVRRLMPERDDARRVLGRWLLVVAAGVVIAVAGWAMYIPADPYYSLDRGGIDNRTNELAAIGVVVAIYASIVLLATLLLRGLPRWPRHAALLTAAVALLLALGYADDQRKDVAAWARASDGADEVLAAVGRALPGAPRDATLYTFGYPALEAPGITIFGYNWDLLGAARITFDDPALTVHPVTEANPLSCRRDGVAPIGSGWDPVGQGARYGRAMFVDVPTGASRRIDSRAECKAALGRFVPGPWVRLPG